MNTEIIKEYTKKHGFNTWEVVSFDGVEYVIFGYVYNGVIQPFGEPHICYLSGDTLIRCNEEKIDYVLSKLNKRD